MHGGYGVGMGNLEERMLLEFCLENELYVSNTWFRRVEKAKVTFRMGEDEKEIVFVNQSIVFISKQNVNKVNKLI